MASLDVTWVILLFWAISSKPTAELVNFQHAPHLSNLPSRLGKTAYCHVHSAHNQFRLPGPGPSCSPVSVILPPSSHGPVPRVQQQPEAGSVRVALLVSHPLTAVATAQQRLGLGREKVEWAYAGEVGADLLWCLHTTFPVSALAEGVRILHCIWTLQQVLIQ